MDNRAETAAAPSVPPNARRGSNHAVGFSFYFTRSKCVSPSLMINCMFRQGSWQLCFPSGGAPMCGRFTLRTRPELVAEEFERPVLPPFVPRWNIAPTQTILALRVSAAETEAVNLRWGLIPSWAKDL